MRLWVISGVAQGFVLFHILPGLHAHVGHLTGVDLAPRMLDAARARGCYHALVLAELTEHLATVAPVSLNVITAADVLMYLGNLENTFGLVALLAAAGAVRFGECGPGKVLAGLIKRIDKALDARALGLPADLDSALNDWRTA